MGGNAPVSMFVRIFGQFFRSFWYNKEGASTLKNFKFEKPIKFFPRCTLYRDDVGQISIFYPQNVTCSLRTITQTYPLSISPYVHNVHKDEHTEDQTGETLAIPN